MLWFLDWLKNNRPDSRLIRIYEKAVEKQATIELDTMWRMTLDGNHYSANDPHEFLKHLEDTGKGETNAPKPNGEVTSKHRSPPATLARGND